MNRRAFLEAAALAVPAFALSDAAAATPASAPSSGTPADKLAAVVAAAAECLKTGRACERHCWEMLGKGNVDLKECGDATRNMLAACEATVRIGGDRTASEENLKLLTAACAAFCRACEERCRKHSKKHKVCADCMESCIDCAQACEAYA